MDTTNTFAFCCKVLSDYEVYNLLETKCLFRLINVFTAEYHNIKKMLPYHVNVIDALHANENANSRILSALLQYCDNGDYVILNSFIKFFMPQAKLLIENPIISAEDMRIDLLVREPGKYALIFENKIFNALLQKNQIARYIIKLRNEGYKDEQIYVVFLPPNEYDTNECSWQLPQPECDECNDSANCRLPAPPLRTSFKGRYHIVTFRDGITQWLKTKVIPNCKHEEVFLSSAAIQYLDYLEGIFHLRPDIMNTKLQELIRKQLNLDDKTPVLEQFNVLREKSDDIIHLLNEIQSMKDALKQTIIMDWKHEVSSGFDKLRPMQKGEIVDVTIGPINGRDVTVLINEDNNNRLFVQAQFDNNLPQEKRNIADTKLMGLHDILPQATSDCRWRYLDHYDLVETYNLFKETVARCEQLIDKPTN